MNPIDLILHLDQYLAQLVTFAGPWFYALMFLIVFCETGLVVMPFLPGDSLLFAVGALASLGRTNLDIGLLAGTFFSAALCGDITNYTIGRRLGVKLFSGRFSRFLNPRYLQETQAFYDRHGGKTIILARFMPMVRTFAPFVAGIGAMRFQRFATFSVVGAALWIVPFLFGGYFLGNVPAVKDRFHLLVIGIVVVSVTPAALKYLQHRRRVMAE